MVTKGRAALVDRAELVRRIEAGEAISAIADAYGLSGTTIEQAIRRAGLWELYRQERMAHGYPDPAAPEMEPLEGPDGRVRARPRRRLDPDDLSPLPKQERRRGAPAARPADAVAAQADFAPNPSLSSSAISDATWFQPPRSLRGRCFVGLGRLFTLSVGATLALFGTRPRSVCVRFGIRGAPRRLVLEPTHADDVRAVRLSGRPLAIGQSPVLGWLRAQGLREGRSLATAHDAGDVRWLEVDLEGDGDARPGH